MTAPRITAAMVSTVAEAPAAVVVLDETAGTVRLQPALVNVDDPALVVLLDHAGALAFLRKRGSAASAAAAATAEARLAVAA